MKLCALKDWCLIGWMLNYTICTLWIQGRRRSRENDVVLCYCCNVPQHPPLCTRRQMASIPPLSHHRSATVTSSSSLQLNSVSCFEVTKGAASCCEHCGKLVKCARTKLGGLMQSGLSQSLDTLGEKPVKVVTLSNVCMRFVSVPSSEQRPLTSGLIKVNWRTRSSGYTRSEMILPARPIRDPCWKTDPSEAGKRDKRQWGAVHVLSNLLKQTVRNRCTNVKAETVKCLTWHWSV